MVPVASPPSWICSRKGLEKASVALARGHAARRRQNVANQLHTFASQFGGGSSHSGDISARKESPLMIHLTDDKLDVVMVGRRPAVADRQAGSIPAMSPTCCKVARSAPACRAHMPRATARILRAARSVALQRAVVDQSR